MSAAIPANFVADDASPFTLIHHAQCAAAPQAAPGFTATAGIAMLNPPYLLLSQKAALSPEMAVRIGKAFGPKADHLMRIQLAHDMAAARKNAGKIKMKRYEPAVIQ